jgi:hypothetical protein
MGSIGMGFDGWAQIPGYDRGGEVVFPLIPPTAAKGW